MAIDLQQVSAVDVEPGELPKTMAAWVIREERFGEPKDAFQIEEIEVPEPGAFEVIVRVMAAGVNYNNVWAALGKPVSVMRYGDHPEFGHHIGGSDASGIVWKVGPGVTRWKPGDEVVMHCNQASYEDPEVHGLDPMAAPSQKIWGYETTWGSFAQFTKVQAQQLLHKPPALSWEEAASYGLVYFTAWRMLMTRCKLQAGNTVLIWGAAGGLGVFATQICKAAGARSRGRRLVGREGRAGQAARRGGLHRPQRVRRDDAQGRRDARGGGRALQGVARASPSASRTSSETPPTSSSSTSAKRPSRPPCSRSSRSGKSSSAPARPASTWTSTCAYLWMRQKEILGSHFANAYECTKANELIESNVIRPVLWRTLGFDGVAEAHQLMMENKHLGKISVLVGAEREGEGATAEGPGAIHAEVGA